MTTDHVGSLVPSVHRINHLELLTMSVDLNAELNAFRATIVTLKDDIIRQRDADPPENAFLNMGTFY